MDRRELFVILTSGFAVLPEAIGQHSTQGAQPVPKPPAGTYEPRFFSTEEYRALSRLCDIVIPSDEQSPGAQQAGVPYYIDTVLHYRSDSPAGTAWKSGLKMVDEIAASMFHKRFVGCSEKQQVRLMERMARNEATPKTELEKFFRQLKSMTVQAYCVSEIGMRQYLGYKGGVAIAEFRGCKDHV